MGGALGGTGVSDDGEPGSGGVVGGEEGAGESVVEDGEGAGLGGSDGDTTGDCDGVGVVCVGSGVGVDPGAGV